MEAVLKTCPLTNLVGERLFGDLDYDINKRRHASKGIRSSICMWKHNGTARWLEKQDNTSSRLIVQKGIKHGPEMKKKTERGQERSR